MPLYVPHSGVILLRHIQRHELCMEMSHMLLGARLYTRRPGCASARTFHTSTSCGDATDRVTTPAVAGGCFSPVALARRIDAHPKTAPQEHVATSGLEALFVLLTVVSGTPRTC